MGNGGSVPKPFGPDAAMVLKKEVLKDPARVPETEQAVFAAGCFWGVQLAFQRVPGVVRTTVGYTMGRFSNPTYEEVCSGTTGHTEAVHVVFRKEEVTYDELLTVLWDRMDPTAKDHQGNDYGTQYRSGIYFLTNEQRDIALASKERIQKQYAAPIATEILPAQHFWPAEDYHQHYLEKLGQTGEKGVCTAVRCYG